MIVNYYNVKSNWQVTFIEDIISILDNIYNDDFEGEGEKDMNWKQKRKLKLFTIVVLLVAAVYFLYPLNESLELGLDLQGGTHVVLEARDTETTEVNNDAMNRVLSVIKRRVNEMGLTEPIVQRQGERRIIVELPGVEDPNQAIETIGRTAQLKFKNEAGEV